MDQEEIKWRVVEDCRKIGIETRVKRAGVKKSKDGERIGQQLVFQGIKLNPDIINIRENKVILQEHL